MSNINQHLEILKKELDQLASFNEEIGKSKEASQEVIMASQKHLESTKELGRLINEHLRDVSEELNAKSVGFEKNIQAAIGHLESHGKDFQEAINKLIGLKNEISEHTVIIQSINFPSRLEKVDNTIASILLGLQNLQAQTMDVQRSNEKSSKEMFNHISSSKQETNSLLEGLIDRHTKFEETTTKKNQMLLMAVVLSALLSAASLAIHFI